MTQASKLMPARMPGAAKNFAGPVNSSYWLPAQHSKLEPSGNYHTNGDLGYIVKAELTFIQNKKMAVTVIYERRHSTHCCDRFGGH